MRERHIGEPRAGAEHAFDLETRERGRVTPLAVGAGAAAEHRFRLAVEAG